MKIGILYDMSNGTSVHAKVPIQTGPFDMIVSAKVWWHHPQNST